MAMYRKLGKASAQRNALLRNQVTQLLYHGKIRTTEARAKEVVKIAEKLITLAVKEKDNYDEVTVTAKVAKKDKDGKRVKEVVDGKKVTVYDEVEKTIKKDQPSRLHARREMLKVLYPVVEVPERLIVRKPADDCILPKILKHEMKILPPEQIKSYLTAAEQRGVLPICRASRRRALLPFRAQG